MRKMDNIASGFGIIAILIPFMISIILTGVSYGLGNTTETLSGMELYIPTSYKNMTATERIDFLSDLHGGTAVKVNIGWDLGNIWTWWQAYEYRFPDGFKMTDDQYLKFVYGDATQVNYMEMALDCLTINPPMLSYIGVWGMLFRIVLIMSIALGLLELIWIG